MTTFSFELPIEEISELLGGVIYKSPFPTDNKLIDDQGQSILSREMNMPNSPKRRVHGFDNACRSAALVPVIVNLMKEHKADFPADWQKQMDNLDNDQIKALQVVALLRASGRHLNPNIKVPNNNPDFGSGSNFAEFGEKECLHYLRELNPPKELDLKRLAHAALGNEYVVLKSTDKKEIEEHAKSKNDIFSLILNVINVLEGARDLSDRPRQLDWMPVYNNLNTEGKKAFETFAIKHIKLIKEQQGYVMVPILGANKTAIVQPDKNVAASVLKDYTGEKFTAKQMFADVSNFHGKINPAQTISSAESKSEENEHMPMSPSISTPVESEKVEKAKIETAKVPEKKSPEVSKKTSLLGKFFDSVKKISSAPDISNKNDKKI